jgi:tetratricopeptide (TPR) repeat protein
MSRSVRVLFDEAAALAPDAREAFLARACNGDDSLRTRVGRMLDLLESNGSFLRTPVLDARSRDALLDADADEPIPERVGRYVIIGRTGVGGMGTVYEAEQDSPRRHVALKLIRAGVASRQALDRFALEAEVLGRLRHEGIAQIYEAGVAEVDGRPRPFIAMELIEGEHIDAYARTLDLDGRLRLVADVCDALHHAHTRGVIHRDLKASNVLVDEAGHPKIVDFGIARLLERDVSMTRTGSPLGTLSAMSPEQLDAGPGEVDTRSDVYALGALAYEIIAGRPAHDVRDKGLVEAARIITQEQPTRLRDIDPAIDTDVETIIATAMAKDRDRRYASAAAMADDIRRYLDRRPIVARPPTLAYQARRWAQRNRALAVVTCAAVVLLAFASIGTAAALVWALGEQERAVARATDAEISLDYLRRMLTSVEPAALGRDARVIQVLELASQSLAPELADRPLLEARLRQMIGVTYLALGESTVAEEHLRRAFDLRSARLSPTDPDRLESAYALGLVLVELARFDEAEPLVTGTYETRRKTLGDADERTLRSLHSLGKLLEDTGRYQEARDASGRLHDLALDALGERHELTLTATNCMANTEFHLGHADEALRLHEETLARRTDVLGRDHPDTLQSLNNLGGVCIETGDLERADELLTEAAEVSDRVRGPRHPESLTTRANLAVVKRRLGRMDDALALARQVLDARVETLGQGHPETIISMGNLAAIQLQAGHAADAASTLEQAIALSREDGQGAHPTTGRLLLMHAGVLTSLGRLDEAERSLDDAETVLVGAFADEGAAMCEGVRLRLEEARR